MKLYFSPGACSLSPHIVLREAGLDFQAEAVNLATHKTKAGEDYYAVNPKGYVPALKLDNGEVLTEGAVIVQYLADQKPDSRLIPKAGSPERYRVQEWLNFISTEVHKGFSPLFNRDLPEEQKQATRDKLGKRLTFVEKQLEGKPYLSGEQFTVADAYLFTILTWAQPVGKIDLGQWPGVKAYFERVGARPQVKAALDAEQAARKSS